MPGMSVHSLESTHPFVLLSRPSWVVQRRAEYLSVQWSSMWRPQRRKLSTLVSFEMSPIVRKLLSPSVSLGVHLRLPSEWSLRPFRFPASTLDAHLFNRPQRRKENHWPRYLLCSSWCMLVGSHWLFSYNFRASSQGGSQLPIDLPSRPVVCVRCPIMLP